jgi:hypothetical protein
LCAVWNIPNTGVFFPAMLISFMFYESH